jgi:thioredoxin 1
MNSLRKVAAVTSGGGGYPPIIDLDESNFDQAISGSPVPILVDFCAHWCGPCHTIDPVLAEIGEEQSGNLKIARVDVDNSPKFIIRFRIRNIPTFVFFKDGEIKDQVAGFPTKTELISRLKNLI